jgi:regulator of RNase E activity RraA
VVEFERDLQERKTLAGRVTTFISFLTSDEGTYQQEYVDAATKGHHILVVHAPGRGVIEQARDILAAHHAHSARHYGSLAVEDLIP